MNHIEAHKKSVNNKLELENSKKCGCFYCLEIFSPSEIKSWLKDTSGTALCPYCDMDSVIPETKEIIIEKSLLKKMKDYWFGPLN